MEIHFADSWCWKSKSLTSPSWTSGRVNDSLVPLDCRGQTRNTEGEQKTCRIFRRILNIKINFDSLFSISVVWIAILVRNKKYFIASILQNGVQVPKKKFPVPSKWFRWHCWKHDEGEVRRGYLSSGKWISFSLRPRFTGTKQSLNAKVNSTQDYHVEISHSAHMYFSNCGSQSSMLSPIFKL